MTKLTIDGYQKKLNNKYFKWYRNIIIKRLENPKLDYHEKHHITPLSLGGSNEKENIVCLSAREHFIIHYLLTKFIVGRGFYSMMMAFQALSVYKSNTRKETYVNSRLYEANKRKISEANSKRTYDMWKDPQKRKNIIKKQKESWKNGKRDVQLEHMKINSPLKNKEIHDKSIESRTANKTNVFDTNNPMKNKEKALKIASKRSGENHYMKKNVIYYYKFENCDKWEVLPKGYLHKFRKENYLTRTDLSKLLSENVVIKNIRMKKENYEDKKDN